MKATILFLMMMLCTTSVFFLSSCSGESETVEYWKVYLAQNFHVDGKDLTKEYLQNRFASMASNPDEYQKAYYSIAWWVTNGGIGLKNTVTLLDFSRIKDDNELQETVKSVVEGSIDAYQDKRIGDDYFVHSYGPMMTKKAMINMESHPDLYIENACKIIGPIEDMRKELASHVQTKKMEKVKVADFDCYNVLYSIDDKFYVICSITEKGNGESELQTITHSKSINEILDFWQALH